MGWGDGVILVSCTVGGRRVITYRLLQRAESGRCYNFVKLQAVTTVIVPDKLESEGVACANLSALYTAPAVTQ